MCNSVGGFGLAIGVHNFKLSDTHWIWSLWKNLGSNPIAKFPYPYTTDLMHNIHVQKHLPYCLSSIWQPCRGGHGSEVPESTPAGFCAFLSDPDPDQESMFCEKPDQKSLSAVVGVCVFISLVKTWVNFGWMDDGSRSLNRSRILKFGKLPDPDPVSKILEQEQIRSLKKWLRPHLVCVGLGLYQVFVNHVTSRGCLCGERV